MRQQDETRSNNPQTSESSKQQRRGRRWMLAGAAMAVIGALSIVGITRAGDGPGWGGHRHMGMMHGDASNPEMAARHIDRMLEHVLPDGTAEQKARVRAIATAAFTDLQPLREQHRAARAEGIKLLTAPTIDRAALEQIRAGQMQLAEQLSKRIVQAMADTAEVLTPAQRATLAEHLQQRMGHAG